MTLTLLGDSDHSFALPDFGIDEVLDGAAPKVVTFVADKPGTYTFLCTIPCGPGHMHMKGTFLIS